MTKMRFMKILEIFKKNYNQFIHHSKKFKLNYEHIEALQRSMYKIDTFVGHMVSPM